MSPVAPVCHSPPEPGRLHRGVSSWHPSPPSSCWWGPALLSTTAAQHAALPQSNIDLQLLRGAFSHYHSCCCLLVRSPAILTFVSGTPIHRSVAITISLGAILFSIVRLPYYVFVDWCVCLNVYMFIWICTVLYCIVRHVVQGLPGKQPLVEGGYPVEIKVNNNKWWCLCQRQHRTEYGALPCWQCDDRCIACMFPDDLGQWLSFHALHSWIRRCTPTSYTHDCFNERSCLRHLSVLAVFFHSHSRVDLERVINGECPWPFEVLAPSFARRNLSITQIGIVSNGINWTGMFFLSKYTYAHTVKAAQSRLAVRTACTIVRAALSTDYADPSVAQQSRSVNIASVAKSLAWQSKRK